MMTTNDDDGGDHNDETRQKYKYNTLITVLTCSSNKLNSGTFCSYI